MTSFRKNFIILALSSFCFSSCLTIGNNFPSETTWIKKDKTKQEDIRLLLGSPYAVGSSGGTSTWSYIYSHYSLWNSTNHKELKVYWHENQTVKHFTFNSSFPMDLKTAQLQKKMMITLNC